MDIQCSGFTFVSDFDSGNLARVEQVDKKDAGSPNNNNNEVPDFEFNIWTNPDCAGTEFENGNRSWFHFGIKGGLPFMLVKLNIVNLNRQSKMYSQGMAPVFRISPGRNQWERVRDKPTFSTEDNMFTLSFKYRTLENVKATTYFAFTYPYSYTELKASLDAVDTKIMKMSEANARSDPKMDNIYYHREVVCYSLEGRRIELLTVSSHHGITSVREPRLVSLFPDASTPRPFQFVDKKVIFLSARVHPGETPSSFVLNGLLSTLLSREDPVGCALRRLYVFKLIPMLNPDGVARGHYRTDTRGVNLNRVYNNPSLLFHPSVYAARALIRYYHHRCELPDEAEQWLEEGHISDRVSVLSLERGQQEHCSSQTLAEDLLTIMNNNYEFIDTPPNLEESSSGQRSSFHSSPELERRCLVLDDGVGKENDPLLPGECRIPNSQTSVTSTKIKPSDSGLFLYIDLHGHASKKGIFMYGNHFETITENVECMLLPKLMSLNSQNFHFSACNFTERNMYLRDRHGGMSREGSGRVAVLKATGLVRSYTLECNYNTGRMVNILPPPVRENLERRSTMVLVPPKYNPHVFEEIGRALGCSILDLTGSNPNSRLANSEFRNLSGVREWLRTHPLSTENSFLGPAQRTAMKLKNSQQVKPTPASISMPVPPVRMHRLAPLEAKQPSEKKENSSSGGKQRSKLCVSGSGTGVLQVRAKCSAVNAMASGSKTNPLRKVKTNRDDIIVKKGPKRIKISEDPKTKVWNKSQAEDVIVAWRSVGRLEKKSIGESARRHLAPDQRRKKSKPK
ncbi:cytosolic carboxypeptidase-like protein 5 isoform X2 [Lycorma delicatula]|uniref:cytosolic carboxypeptidase-like protein 5 isoform X2 n=1 Tax=Lycorma delicatula TaxID=130591 RepID=UPI003F50DA6E